MRCIFRALACIVVCFCYSRGEWHGRKTHESKFWRQEYDFPAPHELNVRQLFNLTCILSNCYWFSSFARHTFWGIAAAYNEPTHSINPSVASLPTICSCLAGMPKFNLVPRSFAHRLQKFLSNQEYLVQHFWHIYRFSDLTVAFHSLSLHSIKLLSLFILQVAPL